MYMRFFKLITMNFLTKKFSINYVFYTLGASFFVLSYVLALLIYEGLS